MDIVLHPSDLVGKEWLLTNGLGGSASGGLLGLPLRRHDGLLVAALDAPRGRTVMLDTLEESVNGFALFEHLVEFRLEEGLPVWRFRVSGRVIERRIVMGYGQNTTHVLYGVDAGPPLSLSLRPWLHIRHADGQLDQPLEEGRLTFHGERIDLSMPPWPSVRLRVPAATFRCEARHKDALYPIETERGERDHGPLWSPGVWSLDLGVEGGSLTVSTESWETLLTLSPAQALVAEQERRRRLVERAHPALRQGEAAQMVLAADAFLFTPRNRPGLSARAHALGDDVRSVIAGYPWFNDWGRDTMIALEGLTLCTGRQAEARAILRTFALYLREGLIPDNIPDGPWPPVYHTADATLWFFHAADRYVAASNDLETRALLLPAFQQAVACHENGTLFGIGVDPQDGLVRAAAPGYQLTWMDAIVGDWVVTPRRGKPVEINALWYNALCVLARWLEDSGEASAARETQYKANRVKASFNQRFWNVEGEYLYDVIDGDPAEALFFRPNQIFAVSLPYPVLNAERWPPVVRQIREKLLTPYGLRSLAPETPGYRPQFTGNQYARDGAYHQGTVWPFLLGAFVDASLRVGEGSREILKGIAQHLREGCVGTVSEVFDGGEPHAPRGCAAQGWSVGEWLRAWVALER